MPSGYPDDPFSPNKPLIFAVLDEQYADPRRRWESLKLHRLLQWLWDPVAKTKNAQARAFIKTLTAYGPLGQCYADLLGHVRLSRVPELLGQLSNDPATTREHVDKDWFGENGPYVWSPTTALTGPQRELAFLEGMIRALDASLGLDSVAPGHPDTWADYDRRPWPPLMNDPADVQQDAPPSIERLYSPLRVRDLVRNRPIDFYSVTDATDRYEVVVATGPQRVAMVTLTPGMRRKKKPGGS